MKKINFPNLSLEEQQSIFGAYGESYSLQEVVIIGGGDDYGGGPFDPFYGDNDYGGPDYGGGGGGGQMPDDFFDDLDGAWEIDENGDAIFRIELDGAEIKAKADTSEKDAIALMLSSMGTAFDSASVAAVIAGIEEIKFIKMGGTMFGVLGTALGAPEYIDQLRAGSAEWDDHIKFWAPVGLMIPGINGGIVLGGGVFLAAWEIYDLANDKK